jgi:hypothetical protein
MLAWQGCIECPAFAELSRIPPAISGGVSTGDAEYHPDPNEHTDGRGTRLPGALGNRLDPEPIPTGPAVTRCIPSTAFFRFTATTRRIQDSVWANALRRPKAKRRTTVFPVNLPSSIGGIRQTRGWRTGVLDGQVAPSPLRPPGSGRGGLFWLWPRFLPALPGQAKPGPRHAKASPPERT